MPDVSTANPRISAASRKLQERAHRLIPGGTHTYSKGDDQYPLAAPPVIARGEGARIWDPDGNSYIEYSPGQRTVTLGHGFPEVVAAAAKAMSEGCNFNRPTVLEGACAERLLSLFPDSDMAKFTKDGSTANTAAVKLARAATGKRVVAICEDHPFFSYDDWAMGLTAVDGGIPPEAVSMSGTFRFNDLASVEALFDQHDGDVACLMLEPARYIDPEPDFLPGLRALCDKHGAVLIFDEMTTAFRWDLNGAQRVYGVVPDLTTVGKGMANGFSLSALLGKRELMTLGGLDHERERVFLLSTTHGAESPALAAAMAVIDVFEREDVVGHLYRIGGMLRERLEPVIAAHDVGDQVELLGRNCAMLFTTRDLEGNPSQEMRSLFLQELARRGVLAPSFMVCFSHREPEIDETVAAVDEALAVYAQGLRDGVDELLVGSPSQIVYRRYNNSSAPA